MKGSLKNIFKRRKKMSKKAYFVECKNGTYSSTICDKCGRNIIDIQEGIRYWNPNPKAYHKNICKDCYDVWSYNRKQNYSKWEKAGKDFKQLQEDDKMESYICCITKKEYWGEPAMINASGKYSPEGKELWYKRMKEGNSQKPKNNNTKNIETNTDAFICNMCKETKPISELGMNGHTKNGYSKCCKSCHKDMISAANVSRKINSQYSSGIDIWTGRKIKQREMASKKIHISKHSEHCRKWGLECIRYSDHFIKWAARAEERERPLREERQRKEKAQSKELIKEMVKRRKSENMIIEKATNFLTLSSDKPELSDKDGLVIKNINQFAKSLIDAGFSFK